MVVVLGSVDVAVDEWSFMLMEGDFHANRWDRFVSIRLGVMVNYVNPYPYIALAVDT